MPAFARAYSNAEIAAVTNYVLAHFGAQTPHVHPKDVAQARQD
jgi:mono/diheme cytochrome c family protein